MRSKKLYSLAYSLQLNHLGLSCTCRGMLAVMDGNHFHHVHHRVPSTGVVVVPSLDPSFTVFCCQLLVYRWCVVRRYELTGSLLAYIVSCFDDSDQCQCHSSDDDAFGFSFLLAFFGTVILTLFIRIQLRLILSSRSIHSKTTHGHSHSTTKQKIVFNHADLLLVDGVSFCPRRIDH